MKRILFVIIVLLIPVLAFGRQSWVLNQDGGNVYLNAPGTLISQTAIELANNVWYKAKNATGDAVNLLRVRTTGETELSSGSVNDIVFSGAAGTGFRFENDAGDFFCYEQQNGSCHWFTSTADGSDWISLSISASGSQDSDRGPIITLYGNDFTSNSRGGQIRHIAGNTTDGDIRNELNNAATDFVVAAGSTDLWAVSFAGYLRPIDSGARLGVPSGTDLPATCTTGEVYHDTNDNACADAGTGDGVWCVCKSTNTWAVLVNF